MVHFKYCSQPPTNQNAQPGRTTKKNPTFNQMSRLYKGEEGRGKELRKDKEDDYDSRLTDLKRPEMSHSIDGVKNND